ncbi:MAG: PTS sugar transporter subunit IIA [Treponema sp.]|jgi:PTS system fructose-specific IIC component/PTS system nitrogen regulatory IIA component|nr:PTS sugar transporter subunit IIA [Treponema sp.]
MFLYEVFSPELIKIGLDAEDKDEVFEEMVDQFCQAEKTNVREELLEALREREAKMSTGIHKGIAIPHGKTNAIENVHGILGVSKKGIDYDALDGQPVYLLFMILAPQKDSEKHLRLLKRLAMLLDNPQFYTELVTQTDPQAANGIIKKYEEIFIASY